MPSNLRANSTGGLPVRRMSTKYKAFRGEIVATRRNEQADNTAELTSQRETLAKFADGLKELSRSTGLPSGSEELFQRVLAELPDRGEDSALILEQAPPASSTYPFLDMGTDGLITPRLKRTKPASNLSIFLAPRFSNKTILLCLSIYLAMITIYVIGLAKSNESTTAPHFEIGIKTVSASVQVEPGASSRNADQVPQLHIAPPYVTELVPVSWTGLLRY